MTNPLLEFVQPAGQEDNPLLAFVGSEPNVPQGPDLSNARNRAAHERASIEDNIRKLKSIVPANEGHKARLDRMVRALETQLAGGRTGRSTAENAYRGAVKGVIAGAQFPVELAGSALALMGNKDLQNFVEENRALVQEELDPQGMAGMVGEFAGTVVGAAPGGGGLANLTGRGIVKLAPSTRIAKAIATGAQGSMKARIATNVATGLPINAIQGAGTPEIEVPEGATPEEAERIRSMNTANRLKNIAIGIGADAVFGAIPGRKPKADAAAQPVQGPAAPIDPAIQKQLDETKAKNAVKVAAKRQERLNKSIAQSEWQIRNPDAEWKELAPQAKRKVYDEYNERRRNSNPNTSNGNAPADQAALVEQDDILSKLEKLRGERDEAQRLAETDERLGIGNDRALTRAAPEADGNANLVYIFADVNGLKGVNDNVGMDGGNQLLVDSRDAMVGALQDAGVQPRVFRYGGDELVAIVPKDKADGILAEVEKRSVKVYGDKHTGSLSGAVFNKLEDALTTEGKATVASRKIEAKARQNIPGRDAAEQRLIDEVAVRLQQEATVAAAVEPPAPVQTGTPDDPFPPEVMEAVRQVESAGGLKTEQEQEAFITEIMGLYDNELDPQTLGSKLQELVEDFTPLDVDPDLQPAAKAPQVVAPEGQAQEAPFIAGESGEPIVAFHGTATKFDNLQAATPKTPTGVDQPGIYFSGDQASAGSYSARAVREGRGTKEGQRIVKANLRMRNPLDITDAINNRPEGQSFGDAKRAALKGITPEHDGVIFRGDETGNPAEYIVFSPDQVVPIKPAGVPEGTRLVSLEHKKPIEELTETQLTKLDDKLTDALESMPEGSPEKAIVQADFDKIRAEVSRRNGPVKPIEAVRPELEPDATVQGTSKTANVEKFSLPVPSVHPEIARIRKSNVRKLSGDELNIYVEDLEGEIRTLTEQLSRNNEAAQAKAIQAAQVLEEAKVRGDEAAIKKAAELKRRAEGVALRGIADDQPIKDAQKRLNKALEERAFRAKATNGVVPEVGKNAIQGSAAFGFGFMSDPNAEDNADRVTNGLAWAAVGLGAGLGVMRLAAKSKVADLHVPSDVWPGSNIADKKIVHQEGLEVTQKSWRERAREWYTGIVRRSYAIDMAVDIMGGTKLPASRNPAKLAAMFGRWVSMAEGALQDKPVFVDLTGNVVPLPAKSYREIIEMVDGDLKGLGKLMTARASIEGQGLRSVPLDPVTADLIYRNAPPIYHQAADAMRQFDLAMSTVLEEAGVLLPGSVQKFELETFYAGLRKVFDPESGPSKIVRDPRTKKLIISPNPIKGRKTGQTGQVYNPAETSASMVPQIYRSAELNLIKTRLVDLWEAAGRPDGLLKQVERRKQPISAEQQLRIDALKQEIKGLDDSNAMSLIAAMDPKSLDPRSNMMTVYREGVLRTYRIDEDIATALTSLQPDELEGLWKVLGLPAQVARQGVVLNPYFVMKQSFIDNWQATLNSQYGFRFGVDQFIGWYNTIRRTPEYQKFISAGGGNSVLQSHDYANVRSALKAVRHGGGGPIETAVKQARELKLLDAWRTLIIPFAESARVGEYLRARSHGASVLDGVYAAKHVTANFSQRGGFTAVRGLDRASMFLNPALQGIDQALYRMGANPFRAPEEGRRVAAAKYMSKAFVSITLPSMYFWLINKDDQEINDLRKTETGSKFWFMRSPVDQPKLGLNKGDIVKIPKPIMDGQIFGTAMEATLDKMLADDPASMETAAKSVAREFQMNLLPTMGVLYYGLQTNTNMAFGNPIVPQGDEELSREHQGEGRASWAARVVSQKVTPLISDRAPEVLKNATTPAGLDYIVSNVGGMLGQDAMLALTQAVEAETKGYVPAKEELPFVSRIFATYPSANVAPIRRFYERAGETQTVGQTINHLVREDPERLLPYMMSNQADYMLVGMYAKARQDIANYRRAAEDIKKAPPGIMSSEDRRTYMRQYMTLMIETARQVNAYADAVDDSLKPRE